MQRKKPEHTHTHTHTNSVYYLAQTTDLYGQLQTPRQNGMWKRTWEQYLKNPYFWSYLT